MKPASNPSSSIPTPVSNLRGKGQHFQESGITSGKTMEVCTGLGQLKPGAPQALSQDWERVRDSLISQNLKFVPPPS